MNAIAVQAVWLRLLFAFLLLHLLVPSGSGRVDPRRAPMFTEAPRFVSNDRLGQPGKELGRGSPWKEPAKTDLMRLRKFGALGSDPYGTGTPLRGDGQYSGGGPNRSTVNLRTGNRLTEVPLVGWSSRGSSRVSFSLYHNSLSTEPGPLGFGWRHSYDVRVDYLVGSSAIVRFGDGTLVPFLEKGGLFERPAGRFFWLARRTDGTFVMTNRSQTAYSFDAAGRLASISDRNGNAVTVSWGPFGVDSISDSTGRSLVLEYESGLLDRIVDPLKRVWSLTQDGGELATVSYPIVDAQQHTREFGYDANHCITSERDRRGYTWLAGYDGARRQTWWETPAPLAERTELVYGSTTTAIRLPEGQQTVVFFFEGFAGRIEDAGGFPELYERNDDGNVLSLLDRRGKRWTSTWDDRGNMLSEMNPEGEETISTFSPENDPLTFQDAAGNVTKCTFSKDGKGRLEAVDGPLDRRHAAFTYNEFGEVETKADGLGRTHRCGRDRRGYIDEVVNPLGVTMRYERGTLGETLASIDAEENRTEFIHDDWLRTTRVLHPGGKESYSMVFDPEDNLTCSTNERGFHTRWGYDEAGRQVWTENGRGDRETYQLNRNGWATLVRNGRGFETTCEYTPRGERWRQTLPDSALTQLTYLPTGEVGCHTNPLGTAVGYEYTDSARICRIDYPLGVDTTFVEDIPNRRRTMTDATGTTVWRYNELWELVSVESPQGTVTYRYNDAGQREERTDPRGKSSWGYDPKSGRLLSMTNPHGEATRYAYDQRGLTRTRSFANGNYEVFGYDERARRRSFTLRAADDRAVREEALVYDPASNLLEKRVGDETTRYVHDEADQLLIEAGPKHTVSYTYDANGNRETRTADGLVETYTVDEADKLTLVSWEGGSRRYGHDAAGRRTSMTTSAGKTIYTYDEQNRIVSITDPRSGRNSFAYNGLNARVRKVDSAGQHDYLRDGPQPTDELLTDGVASYTAGVSERRGGTSTFQHGGLKDHSAQTSPSGAISATTTLDAFGNVVSETGTFVGPFRHGARAGYQTDRDSGLQHIGHRTYDPATGRFLTRDPIEDGRNWYAYCENNPLTHSDPAGLHPGALALPVFFTPVGPAILIGGGAVLAGCAAGYGAALLWDYCTSKPSTKNAITRAPAMTTTSTMPAPSVARPAEIARPAQVARPAMSYAMSIPKRVAELVKKYKELGRRLAELMKDLAEAEAKGDRALANAIANAGVAIAAEMLKLEMEIDNAVTELDVAGNP